MSSALTCEQRSPYWGYLSRSAEACPEATALRIVAADGREAEPVTYAELHKRGLLAAAFLHELGIGEGSIVLTALPNSEVSVALSLGVSRLGAVWAPADQDLTAEQMSHLFSVYEPTVAFLTGNHVEAASTQEGVRVLSPPSWEDLPAYGGVRLPTERPAGRDDTALMLLTSGTTGLPKSVMTPNSLLRGLADGPIFPRTPGASGPDKLIYFGSPAWISYSVVLLQALGGEQVLLLGQGYTKDLYFEVMLRHRPSGLFLWPEVVVDFVTLSMETQSRVASFAKTLVYGGARTPPAALLKLIRGLPYTSVSQVYGSTEAGIMAELTPEDHAAVLTKADDAQVLRRLESAGKCVATTRVVDDEGKPVPEGVTGSVQILQDEATAFKGYYQNPRATAEKFTSDGWFITGDLGRLEDGYLYLDGRDSETIVLLSGDNVYPGEIEIVIAELSGVVEVAVAKVVAGDAAISEVGAFVRVSMDAALSAKDVLEQCQKRLGQTWTYPSHVFIQTEKLPRNRNGKCMKSVLTAQASAALKGSAHVGGA